MSSPSSPVYNVLVTGSSGHLGTALMLSLASLGHRPFGIDILPSPTTNAVGSISDRAFIQDVFESAQCQFQHIIHAATLHKPHVDSHTKSQFIDTNITGTLVLLEIAATMIAPKIDSFIFISTTSAFGAALSPAAGSPAAWIDETVACMPKNIYGVTKVAAEDMCFLVHKQTRLPVLVLRTSRFFPEDDDDQERRAAMGEENLKFLELAYRRCDIQDVVAACVCAMNKARDVGWGKYIISAPPPFTNDAATLTSLDADPQVVFQRAVPGFDEVLRKKGWKCLTRLDRVYDSSKAVRELGWEPQYTLLASVDRIRKGETWRSELTDRVGKKGYHAVSTGVYTQR